MIWGQIKGVYGGVHSPPLRHGCGVLLKTVILVLTSTLLALSLSPIHYYIFCICTALDIICTPTPGRLVKPGCAGLKCVQSECRLDLRRTGLVESSIWEGSARHSPCLPCASALLCTLCCCCMRWTPKREWNGRFGAQVTETPQFQS